ncbi:GntR family transcriptional regulator [soil metagenome]
MRQVRTIRYRDIAEDLRGRVEGGEFTAGRLLPSESELSGHYSASRVTIRKALEALRTEALVDSRQGFGWFVAGETVRQPLARLGTIEAQLEAEGRVSERRILDFGVVVAPAHVRAILGTERVLAVRRVNLADGEPFARVTVWCPEAFGTDLTRDQVQARSFYDLLPITFGGATQVIGAAAAAADDAALLRVPVGAPVLVCERTTVDAGGAAVLLGEYVFPAHRTEFIVELSHPPTASIAPGGLRLVE